MIFTFTLRVALPPDSPDPMDHVDALAGAGCTDALVGTGHRGIVALTFDREAGEAEAALCSAWADVQRAIPRARLIEVRPDLVNLSDAADLLGWSRQNMRKYAGGEIRAAASPFPEPVIAAIPPLYRLAEVLDWLARAGKTNLPPALPAIAREAAQWNLSLQRDRLDRPAAA
ncbi:MAG: hypothetical protein RLY86_3984 [Pseudomonadota bacterium]|jgi:hypothetical protein